MPRPAGGGSRARHRSRARPATPPSASGQRSRRRAGRGGGRGGDRLRGRRRDPAARRHQRLELGHQLLGALPAIGRALLQASHHQRGQRRRHGPVRRDRLGGGGHVGGEHLLRARPGERRPARQQLVRHHAEGVEVGPVIHVRVGHRLFRRHVGRRAQRDAHGRERLAPGGLAQRLGHAEIHHQRVPAAEHHVLGLEIAVDHAVAVGFGERVGDVAEDAHRVADRQLALLRQLVAEGGAVHVRHDVVEQPVGRARVVQRQDMGVLQGRRHLDLAEEALLAERGGELLPQHLERDLAVVLQVVGEIHGRHAAGAELALEAVAAGEGGAEAVGHDHAGARVWVIAGLWRERRTCGGWKEGNAGVRDRQRARLLKAA